MSKSPAELLRRLITSQCGGERGWLTDQLEQLTQSVRERDLHIFLGLAPRKLGKEPLSLTDDDRLAADAARKGLSLDGWSIDGAARVLGLLSFNGQRSFAETFKDLRRTSDVTEIIALYRGLPLYPDPETLDFEVGEGLRSNLRPVFDAIAHNNPFPRDHFDQHRWNHMILKALFIGSPLAPVTGLAERANPELARILLDYAQERRAAGRPISEELWRLVRPFASDPEIQPAIETAGFTEVTRESAAYDAD